MGELQFEVSQGKKVSEIHLNKKAGHGGTFCNLSYIGVISRRITVEG
jgi:hypothetical protein